MSRRVRKIGIYVIEGLNALSLAFYFLFLFFFMQDRFDFGNAENLLLGAFGGFVYMTASFLCGRNLKRLGCYNCLTLAFSVMPVALLAGVGLDSLAGHLVVLAVCIVCMGFVWAPLQVLCCQGEPPGRVQRMVGIYNVTWATVSAAGYFTAGAMYERWPESIFVVTAGIAVLQLFITLWLRKGSTNATEAASGSEGGKLATSEDQAVKPQVARALLRMAWIANPFAFVAANVCTPTIPTIAERFELRPTLAGVFCSVWLFARAAGFVLCWKWAGWHYRAGWLLAGYLVMVASFGMILAAPSLAILMAGQVAFGLVLGLIYYSSLYYSMHVDVAEQGRHGGTHEAVIGAGNCAGPLCGALALHLFPGHPNAGVITVSAALALGFIWMARVWLARPADG